MKKVGALMAPHENRQAVDVYLHPDAAMQARLQHIDRLLHHIVAQGDAILEVLQKVNPDNPDVAAATAALKSSTDALKAAVDANTPAA
jgi:hypothetical protein